VAPLKSSEETAAAQRLGPLQITRSGSFLLGLSTVLRKLLRIGNRGPQADLPKDTRK
jgi:hypothetical protein